MFRIKVTLHASVMRSTHTRWIAYLQLLIIGAHTNFPTIWCRYPDERFRFNSRLEETVWPKERRLWLEHKWTNSHYDLFPKDTQSSDTYQEIRMSPDHAVHHQKQLLKRRTVVNGDFVPYQQFHGKDGYINERMQVAHQSKRRRFGFANGYGINSVWFPTAIGIVCLLLLAVTVFGTVVYYYRVYLPKTNKRDAFNEAGDPKGTTEGVAGWTVGHATASRAEGDRKLAHSAQMYHYQHQKQQMLAVELANGHLRGSEDGSESDAEEADFTVYECPDVTEAGNLEVKNPLFDNCSVHPEPNANGSTGEITHSCEFNKISEHVPPSRITNSST